MGLPYTSPMEPRVLDLLDLTVSQAVLMLHQALEEAPHEALDVVFPPEEMLRDNLTRVLAARGRAASLRREQGYWLLEVGSTGAHAAVAPLPPPPVIHAPAPAGPRPVVLTRDGFGSSRSGLGRRLLLGVLEQVPENTPWLVLVLDGTLLLEDAQGLAGLRRLQERGIPVRIGRGSAVLLEEAAEAFEILEDVVWQRALAGGEATVL